MGGVLVGSGGDDTGEAEMTLGSLFDGIGGFMLAGQMAGIMPIWSSEDAPFTGAGIETEQK